MDKQQKYILFFLLFVLTVIRLYHIDIPPIEIEESWRQADTESIAWNFANYDFHILHPNLNYDGPLPNIPALEIQVTTYVIAILYKLWGHSYLLARIVPLSFFMLSAYYLFLLAQRYMPFRAAAFSLMIYGMMPVNVYYSRAVMPESAALLFWISGYYYFDVWISKASSGFARRRDLVISSVLMSLAIMTKPPVAFIAISMLYLCFQHYSWSWIKVPQLWAYAVATLTLPAMYYFYSVRIAEYKFSLGITRLLIFSKSGNVFFDQEAFIFFANVLPRLMGIVTLALTFIGIFTVSRKQRVILIWHLAMLLEVLLIVSNIRAGYYLIFLTVPGALLAGNLLHRMLQRPTGKAAAVVILAMMMAQSYFQLRPMFMINDVMQTQVKVIEAETSPNDLLIVGSLDPCLLSLSDRRGWRYRVGIYSDIPSDPQDELVYYIEQGAKYFVPVQGKVYGDEDHQIMRRIEEQYQKIEPISGYPIYRLQ